MKNLLSVVLLVFSISSCALIKKDVGAVGKAAEQIVVDCSKQTVKDAIPNMLPKVNQILIDANKIEDAKAAALDQLALSGSELLACAVRQAFEDLSRLVIRGSATAGAVDVTKSTDFAGSYIRQRFGYADGFSP